MVKHEDGSISDHDYQNLVRLEQEASREKYRNLESSNETERSLCGQLMLVSTVFLTVSVVVVGKSDTLNALSGCGKALIVATFVTILASISCGIKFYFDSIAFFNKWARFHHKTYETFRDGIFGFKEVKTEELNKESDSIEEETNLTWLRRQIELLALGAVLCVVLLCTFVFAKPNTQSSPEMLAPRYNHRLR